MQYDEEHWRRTSVNIFLSSLVASVWEESSSRLPVSPLEPELLDEEPLVVLEFRSLGLLWWNSVAVVVLLSSCKSSAFETISAALEGRRLPFYDLCWINCFECLLHCLTWYWVFRLYFIAICDSGTWRELRYNGCAFFCLGVVCKNKPWKSGRKLTVIPKLRLQQHFLYVTVSCCSSAVMTNCNVNVK